MWTLVLVVAVTAFTALAVPAMALDEVRLILSPSTVTINTTSIGYTDIIIENNQGFQDTFNVVVYPPSQIGVTQYLDRYNLKIDAHSNASTRAYFRVSPDADLTNQFIITAKSVNFDNVVDSEQFTVAVQRTKTVYISDLSFDKNALRQGDCFNASIDITNIGGAIEGYKLQAIIKKGFETANKFDDTAVDMGESTTRQISYSYCFDKYSLSGTYVMTVTLRTGLNRLVDMWSDDVAISENENLVYTKTVQYTPFAQVRSITVRNEGNVVESDFFVTEVVSNLASRLFFPIDKVDSVQEMDNKVLYGWRIDKLAPGQEVTIRYEIRFLSIWITGVAIALVVFLAFQYAYMPRISKKAKCPGHVKKGSEVQITIEVKNSTLHELRNVSIIDTIPAISTLVEKFDTLPPLSRRMESGTELTWKIKSLRPLEERVLTYRIRQNMEVEGGAKLPRAYLEYLDGKNQKRTAASDDVNLM